MATSPRVRALAVPEYLRPRIEAAHKRIAEEHPRALSPQAVLNALIICGLEAIEFQHLANGNGATATALQTMAALWAKRSDQKKALAFVHWVTNEATPKDSVSHKLADAIEMFDPDLLQFLNVEDSAEPDPAILEAFRAAYRGEAKPDVVERVYDDSVQGPLTASEQGRD
ncbi:hypothetical protein [Synechococcus sp. HIMB2401]|uniref:hypothetical protein n=1 Tax=Synechococcus sp. HIMB2401 TaxID=3144208 RepID=UPI0036F3B481